MTQSNDRAQHRLLLVEDSISLSFAIKSKLENEIGLEIVLARSLEEAKHAIEVYEGGFFLALLDLTLPDATGDDVVALATSNGVPSIVFTASYSDELRERLFALGAIDYLIKDNPHSLSYVVSLVRRLRANAGWKALVVDDSATARAQVRALLSKYRFDVLEAEGGREALRLLDQHANIRLLITDYNMPEMNGCDLTKAVRQKYPPERLCIIGISSANANPLSASFLKYGANDFLNKPFLREEFFCRITQNMDHLDQVQALIEAASRDPLTGLNNRRHFFELAEALNAQAERDGASVAVGVLDIDGFRGVNEAYGHLAADQALVQVGRMIRGGFHRKSDIVARLGGDAFGVFLYDTDEDTAHLLLDRVRETVQDTPVKLGKAKAALTLSGGLCAARNMQVAELKGAADQALDAAKAGGRNQLAFGDPLAVEAVSGDGAAA